MAMSKGLIRGGRIEEKHANWTGAGESIICYATRPPDRYSSLHPFIAKLGLKSVTMRRFRSIFEFLDELNISFPVENDPQVVILARTSDTAGCHQTIFDTSDEHFACNQ